STSSVSSSTSSTTNQSSTPHHSHHHHRSSSVPKCYDSDGNLIDSEGNCHNYDVLSNEYLPDFVLVQMVLSTTNVTTRHVCASTVSPASSPSVDAARRHVTVERCANSSTGHIINATVGPNLRAELRHRTGATDGSRRIDDES